MTTPLSLPNVTLVAITTRDYGPSIHALKKSLQQIKPHSTIFFTDVQYDDPDFECVIIPKMDWLQYNKWVCQILWSYIDTTHVLLVQHDGFVLDASAWTDEFLQYDYIGAPWNYKDGRNVGNGGFSMRSTNLMQYMAQDKFIQSVGVYAPEDEVICRLYRKYLESKGVRFAPEELAHRFSFEMHPPRQNTFGFHAHFYQPYKEPVVVRRTSSMGDVIMAEPLMERLHNDGYRVILDCLPQYYNLFEHHYFPVEYLPNLREDTSGYRVINLDMAYEVEPRKLVLEAYYKAAGIKDYTLRNAKLNFTYANEQPFFDNYVVLHLDDTAMAHRNLHIDMPGLWAVLSGIIKDRGYNVIQVGSGKALSKHIIKVNTPLTSTLAYVIAGAKLFIGIDSGCAQIAMACGVRSAIFFGSVDPQFRYHDCSNIEVLQKSCPIMKDGCYHSVLSTTGQDCEVDIQNPPCIAWTAEEIIEELKRIL
jgi:hypothetical protein